MSTTIYALGSDFGTTSPTAEVFVYNAEVVSGVSFVLPDTTYDLNSLTWSKGASVTAAIAALNQGEVSAFSQRSWETVIHNSRYVAFLSGGQGVVASVSRRQYIVIYDINTDTIVYTNDASVSGLYVLSAVSTAAGLRIFLEKDSDFVITVINEIGTVVDNIASVGIRMEGVIWYDSATSTFYLGRSGQTTNLALYSYVDLSGVLAFYNTVVFPANVFWPKAGNFGFYCNSQETRGVLLGDNSVNSAGWTDYTILDTTITTPVQLANIGNWSTGNTFPGTDTYSPYVLAKNLGYSSLTDDEFVIVKNELDKDISGVLDKQPDGSTQVLNTVSDKPSGGGGALGYQILGGVRADSNSIIAIRADLDNTSNLAEVVQIRFDAHDTLYETGNNVEWPKSLVDKNLSTTNVTYNVLDTLPFSSLEAINNAPFNCDLLKFSDEDFQGMYYFIYISTGETLPLRSRGKYSNVYRLNLLDNSNYTVKSEYVLENSATNGGWLTVGFHLFPGNDVDGYNAVEIRTLQIQDTVGDYSARIIYHGLVGSTVVETIPSLVPDGFYPACFEHHGEIRFGGHDVIFTRLENVSAKQLEWFYWNFNSGSPEFGVGSIQNWTFDDTAVANISSEYQLYSNNVGYRWLIIAGHTNFLSATFYYLWRPGCKIKIDITDVENYGTIQYPGIHKLREIINNSNTNFIAPIKSSVRLRRPNSSAQFFDDAQTGGGIIKDTNLGTNLSIYEPISEVVDEFYTFSSADQGARNNVEFCGTLGDPDLNSPVLLVNQENWEFGSTFDFRDVSNYYLYFLETPFAQVKDRTINQLLTLSGGTGFYLSRSLSPTFQLNFYVYPINDIKEFVLSFFDLSASLTISNINTDAAFSHEIYITTPTTDHIIAADKDFYFTLDETVGAPASDSNIVKYNWAGVQQSVSSGTTFDKDVFYVGGSTWDGLQQNITHIYFATDLFDNAGDLATNVITYTESTTSAAQTGTNSTVLTGGAGRIFSRDFSAHKSLTPGVTWYENLASSTRETVENYIVIDLNTLSTQTERDPLSDWGNYGPVTDYFGKIQSYVFSRQGKLALDYPSQISRDVDLLNEKYSKLRRDLGQYVLTSQKRERDVNSVNNTFNISGYTPVSMITISTSTYVVFSNTTIHGISDDTLLLTVDNFNGNSDITVLDWYYWSYLYQDTPVDTTNFIYSDVDSSVVNYHTQSTDTDDIILVTTRTTSPDTDYQHVLSFSPVVPRINIGVTASVNILPGMDTSNNTGKLIAASHDRRGLFEVRQNSDTEVEVTSLLAQSMLGTEEGLFPTEELYIDKTSRELTLNTTESQKWLQVSLNLNEYIYYNSDTYFVRLEVIDSGGGSFDTLRTTLFTSDIVTKTLTQVSQQTIGLSVNVVTAGAITFKSCSSWIQPGSKDFHFFIMVHNPVALRADFFTLDPVSGLNAVITDYNSTTLGVNMFPLSYTNSKYVVTNGSTHTDINGTVVNEPTICIGQNALEPSYIDNVLYRTEKQYVITQPSGGGTITMREVV